MATELAPVEGLQYAAANAMSGRTVYAFLYRTKSVGAGTLTSSSTMASVTEESWTSYARQAIVLGTASSGIMAVPSTTWNPGAATDGHSDVTGWGINSASSSGVAIFLWDFQGGAVDMSKANANLVIPSVNYFLENVGGI